MAELQKTARVQADSAGLPENRPQPHDSNVERAVLSAMLREPEPCVDIAIEHLHTDVEVFYSYVHREIYQAILDLHHDKKLKVDLVAVAHLLQTKSKLEAVGGEVFLAELYNNISTTVNIEAWCVILKKYAILRKMINVCSGSLSKCYNPDADAAELIEEIETDIYNVRSEDQSSSIVSIQQSIVSEFHELMKIMKGEVEVGIPTGYKDLDEYTGGLKAGEMFVLAARPSIGKTSLALNVIRNIALPTRTKNPRSIAFFSLEMTAEQISRRLLCTEAGLSESVFRSNSLQSHELTKLTGAVSAFQKARIFIDPTGGISIAELRAKARRLKMKEKIDLIVIDYLQLMQADSRIESRQQQVGEISGGIKKLAKDLKIPILVLAQLNREVDKTAGASARPKLSHLRESGTIEQDADIVTFLHRDREKSKDVNDGQGVEAEWIIEKNRNGRTGNLNLLFFPARMEFVPASRVSPEDGPRAKANQS